MMVDYSFFYGSDEAEQRGAEDGQYDPFQRVGIPLLSNV
jgi:hypothetical protein